MGQNSWNTVWAFLAVALVPSAAIAGKDAPDCAMRKDVLGVSRVVEIDPAHGLLFGSMQHKDFKFLKKGEVVLTFDDGPLRRYSLKVLNALEEECTKATFFMIGQMAISDPLMVREIARRGHTIASHTWSHKNLAHLTKARAEREIELGISAVSAALGKPVAPFFRFPYLSYNKSTIAYLKARDAGIFSIDVDSKDYTTRNGTVVINRVLRRLKAAGKGIILFHDIQRSTAKGIRILLRKLKEKGYKVVHVVAKTGVKTNPKFDLIALKALERRKKSWSHRLIKANAVSWPVSHGGLPARETLKFIVAAKPSKKIANNDHHHHASGDESDPKLPERNPKKVGTGAAKSTIGANKHRRSSSKRPRRLKSVVSKHRSYPETTNDVLQRQIYSD